MLQCSAWFLSPYFGAPTKRQKRKLQLYEADEEDILVHKLLTKSKKKKKKHPHNLMLSVNTGRVGKKKH